MVFADKLFANIAGQSSGNKDLCSIQASQRLFVYEILGKKTSKLELKN